MNAEFNWWLLIVGLVIGAGLVWLILADGRRREVDVEDTERPSEVRWITTAMTDAGHPMNDDDVLDVLRLHAAYLSGPPPDATGSPQAGERERAGPGEPRTAPGSDGGPA